MEVTIITSGENCLCSSSIAKMIAVIGDDAAIENPADAPPVMIYRLQPLFLSEARHFTTPSPTAVPSCTHGPSVPRGIPHKNDRNAENGRIMIHASHLNVSIPLIAATDEGIPPPLQLWERE